MTFNKPTSLRDVQYWTTCQVIDRQYQLNPDKIAIEFVDGQQYRFSDIYHLSHQVASGLLSFGLKTGSNLAVMLPSSEAFLECWWGCHRADMVLVGLNTDLMGGFLGHALNISKAETLVIDAQYLPRIAEIESQLCYLTKVIVVGTAEHQFESIKVINYDAIKQAETQVFVSQADFKSLACLMFTSGTTGPSKAVMMPHAHCYLYGLGTIENLDFKHDDSYYVCMPLYHVNALFMQIYACLINGAKAVIRRKFSASNWLKDIVNYKLTHTNLLGVMSEYVSNQGLKKQIGCRLRVIAAAPASPGLIEQFSQLMGVNMVELYGMSEVNIPLFNPLTAAKPGSCGKAYDDYFEVRIADAVTDLKCLPGEVGEIQVRPKLSAGFMSGYFGMPEQTLEAWRNLWFHTGDAGKMDKQGYVYFIDRLKDCIRRKGENISSYEVETALNGFEGVSESAVIAVPSDIEGGEDEVLAVLISDQVLDIAEVNKYIQQAIPRFARPRYIQQIAINEVPRTSTNKIRKVQLREQTITENCIDLSAR